MSVLVRLVAGVASTALVAALAGCTGDEPSSAGAGSASPSSETPAPATASPGTAASFRVHVFGDARRLRTYEKIVRAYTALHPEVTIRLTHDRDARSAVQTITAQEAAGKAPDVFLLDQEDLPSFVQKRSLVPLDDLLEQRGVQFGDDYARVGLNAFSADDALQCMPAESSPYVLYVNVPLLRRAGLSDLGITPPAEGDAWSWEDFATAARAVAAEDGIGPVKGVYIPPHVAPVTAFVRSAGGAVVDDPLDPSTLTLSGDEARTAVQEVATLVRDSTVAPTEEELGKAGPAEMFARGRLGMYVGTREDLPRLRAARGLLFDVMPLPSILRSQSVSQVKGWCLNAASDDVGPAADFITFAVGSKGARIAARSDVIVPSNLSVVNSPAFTQPGELPRSSGAFFTSLRRSDAMPYSPAWPEVAALADRELGVLFTRSDIDLDTSLERRLTRLDRRSERMFRAAEPRGDEG